MLVFIITIKKSSFKTQDINIVIISANIYYTTCYLKKAQVFAISIKDIQYQVKKKAEAKINLKNILLKEYYDFLIFFQRQNQIFFLYIKNIIIRFI